ncbi:uncharacterized protein LOC119381959 [Rhipicephalus sanguineus]|uniref:uncharacterized protein LOC119381959 n=1 Tax=Rhipicephalus sanguineus TaxID=34632 RepID=UPI0020C522A0|nr:uncharacterized protein LOC119381959 [Rhipicephalus sanguineus]
MSASAIFTDDMTKSLLNKTDVKEGTIYNKKCVATTTTEGMPCLSCRYLRKALLTRISWLKCHRRKKIRTATQKLRSTLQKHRRLSRKVVSLKAQIENMRVQNAAMEEEALKAKISKLPLKQQESVRHCFAASRRKSTNGMHFTNEWMLECIMMRMKSPKLYRHIRMHNILVLPGDTTLRKYTASYRSGFGFNKKVLETLKLKTSTMDEFSRHGGILIDELKLSEHLSVQKCGRLQGFVDIGPFTQPEDAHLPCDHGMVVMFVPFAGKCSQILAVFASHANVKGELLCKILVEATILAEQAGLFVDFITCDGASWNRRMWTLMGIQGTASRTVCKVKHPVDKKRSLHFLSDFPHLIKCLRNCLLKGGFDTPSGRVSMYFVREAFNLDKENVTLKAMPKLTTSHLNPNGFEKMRVSLAFQLFGDSVLRGLQHYKSQLEASYGKGAIDATESFFRMMNRLIKAMTSRFKSEALWPDSDGAAVLSGFLDYISKWEQHTNKGNGFLSKPTATGLRVTISSVLSLLNYVTKDLGYQYLMTSRLSQDPIENLFGVVRQSSGCNDHPTPEQFLITVNCLSFYSLAKPVHGTSVEPVVLTSLLDTTDLRTAQATSMLEAIDEHISEGNLASVESAAQQCLPAEHLSLVKKSSDARLVYYMAGGLNSVPVALVPTNGESIRMKNPRIIQEELRKITDHFQLITEVRQFGRGGILCCSPDQACITDLLKCTTFASHPVVRYGVDVGHYCELFPSSTLIATAACKARVLGFCIRHKVLPPEIVALFGYCLPSVNHGVRICKVMRSEWQRQVRLYRDQLRHLLGPSSSPHTRREFSRLTSSSTEFLWQQLSVPLRNQVQKSPVPTNPIHVVGDVTLPEHVQRVLGCGPKFAVEPQKSRPELLSMVRQVSKEVPEAEFDRSISEGLDGSLEP